MHNASFEAAPVSGVVATLHPGYSDWFLTRSTQHSTSHKATKQQAKHKDPHTNSVMSTCYSQWQQPDRGPGHIAVTANLQHQHNNVSYSTGCSIPHLSPGAASHILSQHISTKYAHIYPALALVKINLRCCRLSECHLNPRGPAGHTVPCTSKHGHSACTSTHAHEIETP